MGDTLPKFTAAAVQAAPVFLDRDATVDKACDLIDEAGRNGAQLIVLPETWIPGYPFWHTTPDVFSGETFAELWKNSVEIPSPSTNQLGQAAKRAGAYVVVGINERDTVTRGTLYNTLLYLAPTGEVMHRHRKLMPTFTERTIWGFGDGSDLDVLETPLGRLGGLICWEHEMTLAKYALYAQGEQVHCAVWPAYSSQNNHIDFGTRQYAFEGACFVVSSCGVVTPGSMPEHLGGDKTRGQRRQRHHRAERRVSRRPRLRHGDDPLRRDRPRSMRSARSTRATSPGTTPGPTSCSSSSTPRRSPSPCSPTTASQIEEPLESATAEEVVDRLEAVRDYLGSLIDRIETDGDTEVNEALAEAMASIDMAATGMWSRE